MTSFFDICCEKFGKFEEVSAFDFYRDLFPFGELQSRDETENHKYNAIACEIVPVGKQFKTHRFTVGNDFENMEHLLTTENFVIMSPMSYVGKARTSKNARLLYALVFDLDGVKGEKGLDSLFVQMQNDIVPSPTFFVCSGTGLHLYFVFVEPVPMFPSVTEPLEKLKNDLTKLFWNPYVTKLSEENQIQYEPIWQGFRIVGGVTKDFKKTGHRVKAWRYGKPVSLEYLNRYALEENRIPKSAIQYKSQMSLQEAKEKFPDWYERKIVKGQGRKYWNIKADLYYWWLKRISTERICGHRYYCIMTLAIYAKKCGISFEELRKDAYGLLDNFNSISPEENQFTEQDIRDGLKAYKDEFRTMPINSIMHFSGIRIEKNKRNGRKQKDHIKLMNKMRELKIELGEISEHWQGRKPVADKVFEYYKDCYRTETKPSYKDFCEKTGLKKSVFYKYQDEVQNRLADLFHDSCEGSFLLETQIMKGIENQEK